MEVGQLVIVVLLGQSSHQSAQVPAGPNLPSSLARYTLISIGDWHGAKGLVRHSSRLLCTVLTPVAGAAQAGPHRSSSPGLDRPLPSTAHQLFLVLQAG